MLIVIYLENKHAKWKSNDDSLKKDIIARKDIIVYFTARLKLNTSLGLKETFNNVIDT